MAAPESPITSEINWMTALDMSRAIRSKHLSARELMQAHLEQIARVNKHVNAIVTVVPSDELLSQASAADQDLARGRVRGPLHGLPLGVKDLNDTKGIRTTYGSPVFRDHVPVADAFIVAREKLAGAIVVGKTNVPEWAMGSQTFNPVFGATLNPYDVTKTCGGSTGGGSVALACGMVPLADGTDFGGSLRNPANFCNVVGLRPSPGRVPTQRGWFTLAVSGPVARNVKDCAFFLSALSGFSPESPIAIDQPAFAFENHLERSFKGVRVAIFESLGLPWEPEVREKILAQAAVFESLGCIVEQAEPDFADANEAFMAQRHSYYEARFGDVVNAQPGMYNEYVHWHVDKGRKLTGPYLSRMENKRADLYHRARRFMQAYEFFILPVSQVLPFDVTTHLYRVDEIRLLYFGDRSSGDFGTCNVFAKRSSDRYSNRRKAS